MDAETIRQLRKNGLDDVADELERESPTAEQIAEVLHPWATVWMSDGHPSIIPRSTLTMATDLLERSTILRRADDQVPGVQPLVHAEAHRPDADHPAQPAPAAREADEDDGQPEVPAVPAPDGPARAAGESPLRRDQARARLINELLVEWHEDFRHIITFGEFMVAQEQKGRA